MYVRIKETLDEIVMFSYSKYIQMYLYVESL